MEKVTKEELLKAIKKAKKHKNEARKKTAKEWEREGIKGKGSTRMRRAKRLPKNGNVKA